MTAPAPHRSVYMVARAGGGGYRRVSPGQISRMVSTQTIAMEGVDGDEDTNTVTYWYQRAKEI